MAKNQSVANLGASLEDLHESPSQQCRSCLLGKFTRDPFPASAKATAPLQRLHSDLCGPLPEGMH
eukprot:316639-Chlamydomonas_euryale.AAC.1